MRAKQHKRLKSQVKPTKSLYHRVERPMTDVFINNFLQSIDSPRALTVWLLYEHKEHDQLASLECNPNDYPDYVSARNAYTASAFLSKADFLDTTFDRKVQAFIKFARFEEKCRETNYRFRNAHLDPLYTGPNVWLLNAARRKIEQILGDFSAEELFDVCDWGPGVTNLIKGSDVAPSTKFQFETGITRDLYSLVGSAFAEAYPSWSKLRLNCEEHLVSRSGFTMEVGNVITTVPKNSKTERIIAVEPGVNLWFQKGCGAMLRRRLRRIGIDLNNQSINQELCKTASSTGDLATVDFSSASDSISSAVVEELLPRRWFNLLESARSHFGKRSKEPSFHRWEKFSSMGNGFTFELESLIFYAAAHAVCSFMKVEKPVLGVYGDDVIIPNTCYDLFSSFSAFLGFQVNNQKSFSSGYFRESCGAHYYDGKDLKPFYLKGIIRDIETVYRVANGVRRLAHRRNGYYGCDVGFRFTFASLVESVPKRFRRFGADALGDGHFIGNFDEATPSRADRGWEGFTFPSMVFSTVRKITDTDGLLLDRIRRGSLQEHGNTYALRGRTTRRYKKLLVAQWYDLGPWT